MGIDRRSDTWATSQCTRAKGNEWGGDPRHMRLQLCALILLLKWSSPRPEAPKSRRSATDALHLRACTALLAGVAPANGPRIKDSVGCALIARPLFASRRLRLRRDVGQLWARFKDRARGMVGRGPLVRSGPGSADSHRCTN